MPHWDFAKALQELPDSTGDLVVVSLCRPAGTLSDYRLRWLCEGESEVVRIGSANMEVFLLLVRMPDDPVFLAVSTVRVFDLNFLLFSGG